MNEAQVSNQRLLLTWPAPTGISASKEASQAARINHYLTTTQTKLGDNTSGNSRSHPPNLGFVWHRSRHQLKLLHRQEIINGNYYRYTVLD